VLSVNSVRSKHINDGEVKAADLATNAVTSTKVRDASLLAADFKAGQIPAGQAGPAGPAGAAGSPGPQGLQGSAGAQGPAGADGSALAAGQVAVVGGDIVGFAGGANFGFTAVRRVNTASPSNRSCDRMPTCLQSTYRR
jgi:hypothetical protein